MNMKPMQAMDKQQGLSLIELMVALLLSTLLILGVTQIYIDNKRNYAFQQGQSDNIENARYALLLLEEELFRTGYRTRPDGAYEQIFRAATSGDCSFSAGEVINYDADAQRLCLRYQPNLEQVTSCTGATIAGASEPYTDNVDPVVVSLQISNDTLTCNGVALIPNLVGIELRFGVSDDSTRETQQFKSAPAAGEFIRSVRYAALLKSRSENLADTASSSVYSSWHAKWRDDDNAEAPDRALYLAVENTVALRNLSK